MDAGKATAAVARIKRHTVLPVCVGFGVKDAVSAGAIARGADGVVVGTALVEALRASLLDGKPGQNSVKAVTALVGDLAAGVRGARARAAE